jgi:hypothetical protein
MVEEGAAIVFVPRQAHARLMQNYTRPGAGMLGLSLFFSWRKLRPLRAVAISCRALRAESGAPAL